MPLIGAVADDLTGATTTGVLLARSKAKTAVFFNEKAAQKAEAASQLDAILISSNSRAASREEAYEKVTSATKALKKMGVKYYSKRIDTTLRGGIGTEISAMLGVIQEETIAVVVPAMPQSKRIVVGGFSLIDGVALVKTPVAQDVRTPVTENFVPRLLAGQTGKEVGLVSLDQVLQGKEQIKLALKKQREEKKEIIVVDAVTLEDVGQIAKACVELGWNILAVDPGPFTVKLAYERELVKEEEPNIPLHTLEGQKKTVLAVAGSATPVTKTQIERLCEDKRHLRIGVDPLLLLAEERIVDAEIQKVVDNAVCLLNQENPPRVILFETALSFPILNLEAEEQARGYENGECANLINQGLGRIIEQTISRAGEDKIAGIYTTGGDTMVNVCYHLGVECIEMLDYVIAQTDVGRMIGKYKLPIIGKGGLTGHDTIVNEIVDRLFKEAARK